MGDHNRREAHAAAAVDHGPFSRTQAALIDDSPERGDKATAECRRFHVANFVRQPHEVGRCVGNGDVLGKAAPAGEAGLVIVVADLLVAGGALGAGAAAQGKGYRNPLADLPAAHLRPDGDDAPRELMARYVRRVDIGVVAHPAVPVAAAKASRADLNDDAVGWRLGIGQFSDGDWPGKGVKDRRSHAPNRSLLMSSKSSMTGKALLPPADSRFLRPRISS